MGHETVGRVVAVGPRPDGSAAASLAPGQLVTIDPIIFCGSCAHCAAGMERACPRRRVIGVAAEISAAFAELMTVPADNAVPLPESMPEEYGALVEPLAVGYHSARRGTCTADDSVLVIGGGAIGQACVLGARRLGVTKIAVSEPSAHRRRLVGALGATCLDPTDGDLPEQLAAVLDGPATLVFDAVGATGTLADAVACADLGARIVLVGMAEPRGRCGGGWATDSGSRTTAGCRSPSTTRPGLPTQAPSTA
jgi:threonine dehydrogenase-like Zn-dependent dehydrogenase